MAENFRRDRSSPIAELARLISQVHGERAHADNDFGEETGSVARLPPAPQLPADLNGPEQAFELHSSTTTKHMTWMINAAPPMSGIRMKFRACADAASP
jgi:hypothetical protein